jgi:hypothetical protein
MYVLGVSRIAIGCPGMSQVRGPGHGECIYIPYFF